MRLSYCTWGMMNVGIEDVIPAVAKIGYRGIELAVTPRFPTDLYSLDAALEKILYRNASRLFGIA